MTKTYDIHDTEPLMAAEEPAMAYGNTTTCMENPFVQTHYGSEDCLNSPEWDEVARLSIAVGLEQMKRGMGSTTAQVWEETKQMMGWK